MSRTARSALGLLVATALAVACSGSSTESSGDLPKFCSQLASAANPFATDEKPIAEVTEDLRQLRLVAPDEIRSALEALEVAFETVGGQPDRGDAAALIAAQQEEVITASQDLADYALANCGIDLSR